MGHRGSNGRTLEFQAHDRYWIPQTKNNRWNPLPEILKNVCLLLRGFEKEIGKIFFLFLIKRSQGFMSSEGSET